MGPLGHECIQDCYTCVLAGGPKLAAKACFHCTICVGPRGIRSAKQCWNLCFSVDTLTPARLLTPSRRPTRPPRARWR
jgi:hypothetical protein